MLNLPVIRDLPYFSPTSFLESEECEYGFYLTRMSEYVFPRLQQTEAMAIGCAFDSFAKAELAYVLGKKNKKKNLLATLLQSVEDHNKHIIPLGNQLFEKYYEYGCFDNLIQEGMEDIELVIHKNIAGVEGTLGEVKLFGKPDATLVGRIPLDWKVSGFGSAAGQSPKQGYFRCLSAPRVDKGVHPKYGLPLETIDIRWATQLVFYNWMLGNDTLDMSGRIEQCAIRPTATVFASYRAKISPEFITITRLKLTDRWNRFRNGEIADPIPTRPTCEPYNHPKICTAICEKYKQFFDNKAIMGLG